MKRITEYQFWMIAESGYTVLLLPAFVGCILTYKTEVPKIEAKRIINIFLALLVIAILTDGIEYAIYLIYLIIPSNIVFLVADLSATICDLACITQ